VIVFRYKNDAARYVGGLSNPEKMPGPAWNLEPLVTCNTGRKLGARPGTVCSVCYGLSKKSRYVRFAKTMKPAWDRRLAATQKEYFVDAMVKLITGVDYFRWHDTGDVYSLEYWQAIRRICELTPDTKHWLPTKEYWIRKHVWPENLIVRFSLPNLNPNAETVRKWVSTMGLISSVSEAESAYRCRMVKKASRDGKGTVSSCGECRRCWDASEIVIDYHLHST